MELIVGFASSVVFECYLLDCMILLLHFCSMCWLIKYIDCKQHIRQKCQCRWSIKVQNKVMYLWLCIILQSSDAVGLAQEGHPACKKTSTASHFFFYYHRLEQLMKMGHLNNSFLWLATLGASLENMAILWRCVLQVHDKTFYNFIIKVLNEQ